MHNMCSSPCNVGGGRGVSPESGAKCDCVLVAGRMHAGLFGACRYLAHADI